MRRFRPFIILTCLVAALGVAYLAGPVLAQVDTTIATDFTNQTGLVEQTDVRLLIIRAIQFLLGFLGLVAVIIIMYGGWMWMTAAGNAERVEQARAILRNGLIGLAIILASAAIVGIVFALYQRAVGPLGGGGSSAPQPCLTCSGLGGIIEDHYPERGAEVPRNTSVMVTFKEPIFVGPDGSALSDSIITNPVTTSGVTTGSANPAIFALEQSNLQTQTALSMQVSTNDKKTFVFSLPADTLLGNSTSNTPYEATVKRALRKIDGADADTNPDTAMGGDYTWSFTVTTEIDVTSPRIVQVKPRDTDIDSPRAVASVTFNEAINALSVQNGITVSIRQGIVAPLIVVQGRWQIGNGYRTIEFIPEDECGVNACGQPVYCLPRDAHGDSRLSGEVKAAELWSATHTPACTPNPYADNANFACRAGGVFDGVVDLAGNSLDGERGTPTVVPSGDGTAEGPGLDNFRWAFETNDSVILTAPVIESVEPKPAPDAEASGINPRAPFIANFSRSMSILRAYPDHLNAAITRDPVKLFEGPASAPPPATQTPLFQGSLWVRQTTQNVCAGDAANHACELNRTCAENNWGEGRCGKETVELHHSMLKETTEYEPRISSTVKDDLQNCFYESVGPLPNDAVSPTPPPWEDQPFDTFN